MAGYMRMKRVKAGDAELALRSSIQFGGSAGIAQKAITPVGLPLDREPR
jgi:hypothetical protein